MFFKGVEAPPAYPKKAGDVVARDLDVPGLGSFGHIGFWDGSRVIEVVNEGAANKVKLNNYENFLSRSKPWNPVYTNISNYFSIRTCYQVQCGVDPNDPYNFSEDSKVTHYARYAIAARAYQIYLIGSDYTLSVWPTVALPGTFNTQNSRDTHPATRGVYRCDAFIIDIFSFTSSVSMIFNNGYSRTYTSEPTGWLDKMYDLVMGTRTPASVYNKLKNL